MSVPGYISLSQLAGTIEDAVDAVFSNTSVWVVAEISNLKHYPAKGHYYFDLVEKSAGEGAATLACMPACSWKQGTNTIRAFEEMTGQPFSAGIQVLIQVAVTFHKVYGMKLVLQDISPEFTIGNLHRQRQDTLDRLLRECPDEVQLEDGIYTTKNKRVMLNPVIQSIAVISSSTAAGYEDFRRTLQDNSYGFTFSVHSYYTPVQGQDADRHIVDCLIDIFQSGRRYDAVILVRGGGSRMDLLTYDSYRLARAVARFPIPVITGIGHLRDISVVDLMAHTHEITPTRAAAFIIGHNCRFDEALGRLRQNIIYGAKQLIDDTRLGLKAVHMAIGHYARDYLSGQKELLARSNHAMMRLSGALLFRKDRELMQLSGRLSTRPQAVITGRRSELTGLSNYLKIFSGKYLQTSDRDLQRFGALFRALQPERTLQRGFAIISHRGKPLKDTKEIAAGDEIMIRTSDAVLAASVTDKIQPDESTSLL